MARLLGVSLADVSNYDSQEIAIWNSHFAERPPDAVERLLAQILVVLVKGFGSKKKVGVYDVAPWLQSADEKKKKVIGERDEHLAMVLKIASKQDA